MVTNRARYKYDYRQYGPMTRISQDFKNTILDLKKKHNLKVSFVDTTHYLADFLKNNELGFVRSIPEKKRRLVSWYDCYGNPKKL